ncbi:glycosyltransferase family A protein [Empedobacter brevis]|uniref:glycosyltransferase family A protein n=1 Tax=Empedobacter brevis TaxID=247 RepID=UPI0039AF83FE
MITIFTPTYNRAYILTNLFKSLKDQTCHDFQWLIIDDGSTDNTKELVDYFITTSDFKIKYLYQENQGKHIAINTALENIETDFFVTVDSDDIMLSYGIEIIMHNLHYINEKQKIICLAFPRKKKNSEDFQVNKKLPFTNIISTPYEILNNYGVFGEFSFVFLHRIHHEFKYPYFENEKFIKESVVYNRIFKKYKLMYFNTAIVESEYLTDGLTSHFRKLLYNNPKGASLSHIEKANTKSYSIDFRLKESQMYWDFESVYNKSFFNKLSKIKSIRLKILIIKNMFARYFIK